MLHYLENMSIVTVTQTKQSAKTSTSNNVRTGKKLRNTLDAEKLCQDKLLSLIEQDIQNFHKFEKASESFKRAQLLAFVGCVEKIKMLQSRRYTMKWLFKQLKISKSKGFKMLADYKDAVAASGKSAKEFIESL